MSLFTELKRRNVFRVGIAYVLTAWILAQAADFALDLIGAPNWILQSIVVVIALGFPIALIFAWAFEMTPEGIKRESEVDREASLTPQTGKKLDRMIIGVMAIVIVLLLVDRFYLQDRAPTSQPQSQQEAAAETQNSKSIAVLPFADLSQGQDQRWFADGLAEEILNALARAPDLLVSSRTSSFKYRDSELDIPRIAEELGVAHVLEGSVRGGGDRIRVTAQLIRASDGFHVWSENYDRDVADMISIQEDLAHSIAQALETTMDPAALAEMTRTGTRSVSAYEQYLRGMEILNAPRTSEANSRDIIRKGYDLFEEARRLDPGFARAHERAANFWKIQLSPNRISFGGTETTIPERVDAYLERINLAIEHAANPANRTLYMADKMEVELRFDEALQLVREYVRDHPNDLEGAANLNYAAVINSRPEAAREAIETARERALRESQAAIQYLNMAHRVLGAERASNSVIQLADHYLNRPSFQYQAHRTLAWARRYADARRIYDRFKQMAPEPNPLLEARQACMDGDREAVENLLADLDPNDPKLVSTRWQLLLLLGRDAEASESLRVLAAQGPLLLRGFLVYAQFDPRPFPALMAVLKREGIDRPPPVEIPFKCPPPEETSIAVLPFVNMSADAENEFFSDGVSEEILNVLARIPELKVAARTSAFAFKNSTAKIADIARELGVNHVLEGSVRKAGGQVRVTAQLIQASDGFHLWSETYDRKLDNIFAIQDEIAAAIAGELKVSLGLEAGEAGNLTGTNDIAAYEHYLKGYSLWYQRTARSLQAAIEEFEQAIALDPEFAKAYAGLAMTWVVLPGYISIEMAPVIENTRAAAEAALELDSENVEALAALGMLKRYQAQFEESQSFFESAIELNPSFATAHQWYGSVLGFMGDPRSGLEQFRLAWSLDPKSRIIGFNLAWALQGARRLEEALEVNRRVREIAPDFPDGLSQGVVLYITTGACNEVPALTRQLVRVLNKTTDTTSTYEALCRAETPEQRAPHLATLLSWAPWDYADPENPSLSYVFDFWNLLVELGEFDTVFRMIEMATESDRELIGDFRNQRTPNGIIFQCDPRWLELERERGLPDPVDPVVCP